jgi:hypothetical protein
MVMVCRGLAPSDRPGSSGAKHGTHPRSVLSLRLLPCPGSRHTRPLFRSSTALVQLLPLVE